MRKPIEAEFIVEKTETSDLRGGRMRLDKFQKGLVSFSTIQFDLDDNKKKNSQTYSGIALDWEYYSELSEDSGFAVVFDILNSHGLNTLKKEKLRKIKTEIRQAIGKSAWKNFELHLNSLSAERENEDHDEILIIAAWAQLFAEPFEELWLAAMANHAYMVKNDDFAFGYFTALIHQKRQNEGHFLRGKRSLDSAHLGGVARSNKTIATTERTLAEIKRLVQTGHSLARAAELSHKNGFGTSPEANRKLWNRHLKK